VLTLEESLDLEAERQLYRLTGGARRRDDDDASGSGLGREVGLGIGGEEVVAGDTHGRNIEKSGRRACAPPAKSRAATLA